MSPFFVTIKDRMAGVSTFKFKQFEVSHHKSSMKVGSDAVLVATWVNIAKHTSALDIGTGCGIIALILAQRNPDIIIHAIDIDTFSVEEAAENFINSKWNTRLKVEEISAQSLSKTGKLYDLMITNPPYFVNSLKANSNRRCRARHADDALPFSELLKSVSAMLATDGCFACILPESEANAFFSEAEKNALFCKRLAKIKTVENGSQQRYLMEFSKQKNKCIIEHAAMMDANKKYTNWYLELTKEFYLNLK